MTDSIRAKGTHVKVKSTSRIHEGVEGIVDKCYNKYTFSETIQIKLDKKYIKHRAGYKSRIPYSKELREGKFIMTYAKDLREIPKETNG